MKPLAIDTETSLGGDVFGPSAKDPNNDYYTIQWGTSPDNVVLMHNADGFKRQPPQAFLDELKNATIVIGHNLAFDLGYLWKLPEWQAFMKRGGEIWDTAQCEYLLSGQRHKFPSLAELQLIYLGKRIKADRISYLFKKGIGPDKILKKQQSSPIHHLYDKIIIKQNKCPRLFKLYEQYAYDDVSTVLHIFKAQWERCQKEGVLELIRARQKALLGVTVMMNTGINVDTINCEKTLREFKLIALEKLGAATKCVTHLWNDTLPLFNINSPKHKSAILFGGEFKLNVKEPDGFYKNGNPKTKTVEQVIEIKGFGLSKDFTQASKIEGRFSTDDKVMNTLYKHCDNPQVVEYCKLQKEAMRYDKMASTYLAPFLKYSVDGILYPHYNPTLTQTGRLSSSAPNLQNVPASGEMLVPIQGQLIAPEGWVCCDIDYSSLEPFCTALITGDEALTNDLLTGVCLHCRAVSWIPRLSEGKSYEEIYELAVKQKHPAWVLKRKKAKAINFKRAYGGGARGLAEAEDLAIEDIQAVFDSQDLEYPQVKAFNDRLFESLPHKQQLSRVIHFSKTSRRGRKFECGLELLPIYRSGDTTAEYRPGEYRHFGTYTSPWGHKVTFEEYGQIDKYERLYRRYSSTETKNYQIQSTAGLVVELALAECMDYVLKNDIEVRMVRQIHDSLSFYIRDNENKNLHIQNLCAIMNNIKQLFKKYLNKNVGFNFRTEAKVGENFASMNEVNLGEEIRKNLHFAEMGGNINENR